MHWKALLSQAIISKRGTIMIDEWLRMAHLKTGICSGGELLRVLAMF
jgi:hypothetical protein